MITREKKDSLIAAAVTLVVAALMLLLFFFVTLGYGESATKLLQSQQELEEEELFVDPELLVRGEEDVQVEQAPSSAVQGEPEKSETEVEKINLPGVNPDPAPVVEKVVSTPRPSAVKATEPQISEEEKSKVASAMAAGFSGRNGRTDGTPDGGKGSGGNSAGISGSLRGRTFLGCPAPDVTLRHKTVVKVLITVDENGRVISANATGGADASIRRKCEQSARAARWSQKPGVAEARGSITFTITPR